MAINTKAIEIYFTCHDNGFIRSKEKTLVLKIKLIVNILQLVSRSRLF